MYEHMTYEGLLDSMLAAALAQDEGLDTREGSVLWYGQAPAAAEAQNLYIQLDAVLNETFADTAGREYLCAAGRGARACAESGLGGAGAGTASAGIARGARRDAL